MRIETLPIADIELPAATHRLRELAYDLWWSYNPRASRLFAWIDPEHWRRYHNPVELLINVDPHKWNGLLADPDFVLAYGEAIRSLDEARAAKRYHERRGSPLAGPVAYFSMEFGLHESLGVYSGGLGVLAGDHCKAASDLGVPLVGVGLLYRSGYFRQTVDIDGFQQHIYPDYDFARLPVQPARAPAGGPLTVPIDLPGRVVHALVWVARVGGVQVIFLDTDIPLNEPADRPITGILYVRGREMRLAQELVLGVGGVRALRALGIRPAVWHMNEGHVAMLALERVRERLVRGESFGDASHAVSRSTVFTTHTPVPAGNEVFSLDLVKRHLEPFSRDTGIPAEHVLGLGAHEGHFNLTVFSIRLSASTNGVSALHGEVSSNLWRHLWPDGRRAPISAITNGVHTETWAGPEIRAFFTRFVDERWEDRLLDEALWNRARDAPDGELVSAHRAQKERLVRVVRERLRKQWSREGSGPTDLRRIETLLDPSALIIGFARRFATYKRATLLLSDKERLRALLGDRERPVQLIFAGKAHPADRAGQEYIRELASLATGEFHGRVFFLEDYDIDLARMLVQGVDVWLNTPRRPQEASGTSGQKAALNGALNLSIADGWWAEAYDGENGFIIGRRETARFDGPLDGANGGAAGENGDVSKSPPPAAGHEATTTGIADDAPAPIDPDQAQDVLDATSLYDTLEEQVVARYFENGARGDGPSWVRHMKASIATITPRFSARRMVRDYLERIYVPVAQAAAGGAGASVGATSENRPF
jgi:starch phosphorylase